jgi:hypothetical protein
VATASNFGMLGQPPTHPELLDTLAVRFVQSGWSLKWLHRQLVHSAVYQLSSRPTAAHHDIQSPAQAADSRSMDPANRLLWRFSGHRLDVEAWRDAILAVSGQLDRVIGGPAEARAEAGHVRRTIYSTISRREPDKMLVTFDFPDANVTNQRRDVTTVPQQQLFVLNSEFMQQAARAWASRVSEASGSESQRLDLMYRWAFGRHATDNELRFGREFLEAAGHPEHEDQLSAWEQFAQAILASNEFSWID